MHNHRFRIPALMARTGILATTFGLACSSWGSAFEMGEVAIATGYRQDTGSFSICSGLASPEHFGFGKVRARDVHIWEIGIGASASLTARTYLRAAVSYGAILGGKVTDSGVADINSNPLNSVLGRYYTSCCGCECEDICGCDCPEKTLLPTVQAKAQIFGNVVDANVALGYSFHPFDDFLLAPVVGWTYNSQRHRWTASSFGPLHLSGSLIPCNESFTPVVNTPPADYFSWDDPTVGPNQLTEFFAGCTSFADCFNGTVYRARWTGPFIGVDLGYALCEAWNLIVGYAFSFNNYEGKFETFGGESYPDSCACDLCPDFLNGLSSGPERVTKVASYPFKPSTMRFDSYGIGQEVSVATDYRCGNWRAGLGIGYAYKHANHCADSDPCVSCETTANPDQFPTAGNKKYPVWSYATLQKARWSSFSAVATLGYQF